LLDVCRLVGKSIANVIKKQKNKWIILASSDFSHYVPQNKIKGIDMPVINAIKKLDGKKFFEKINEKGATVCGFGAIATAMSAAKELGAKKVDLLSYKTSGDVSGDTSSVVGYASIIIY
jgi:AmmeMemoRadiSam system protein B